MNFNSPFPPIELPDGTRIDKPHREWAGHQVKWRWLLDSYEGGDAYRYGDYQSAACGTADVLAWSQRYRANLVPHKREWANAECTQTNDDYAMRLLRTPVPTFVSEAIDKHLGKVYNQEIRREGPKILTDWQARDVDGQGSSIDHWMSCTAPLFLAMGCIDVLVERPPAPDGEVVSTRADELRLGLDGCRISYILPQNTLWWKLDDRGRYVEVLVRECGDDGDAFVYWNKEVWQRYDADGKKMTGARDHGEHGFGRVPIFRAFDDPKRPRCRNVAMPRYENVAELQREYYNRDSELILSDTLHAHPTPQGPEKYCKAGAEIPAGPGDVLPKAIVQINGTSYVEQDWSYVDPPKGADESLRKNKGDIRDEADRAACLTKPAGGAAGTGGDSVGQSGVSKRIDQTEGNQLLGEIAGVLQRFEEQIAAMAILVLTSKPADPKSYKVVYPKKFDLFSLPEYLDFVERFEGVLATVGALPDVEGPMLKEAVRLGLPGRDDSTYKGMDAAIDKYLQDKAQQDADELKAARAAREAMAQVQLSQFGADDPSSDSDAFEDPSNTP